MNKDRVDKLIEQWEIERPDLDATPMGVLGRLILLNKTAENGFEDYLKSKNLTQQEFDVMAVIRRCGSPFKQTVGEICKHTLLSSGAMTNRIDRLEKKGLVSREQNPNDRRGVLVALSEKGLELINQIMPVRYKEAKKFLSPLSYEERVTLEKLLRKLVATNFD